MFFKRGVKTGRRPGILEMLLAKVALECKAPWAALTGWLPIPTHCDSACGVLKCRPEARRRPGEGGGRKEPHEEQRQWEWALPGEWGGESRGNNLIVSQSNFHPVLLILIPPFYPYLQKYQNCPFLGFVFFTPEKSAG